jgi:hypothetical protein
VGGRFGFFYGAENGFGLSPGLRAQAVLRWLAKDWGSGRLGLEMDPGVYAYFGPYAFGLGGVALGFIVPLQLTAAFPLSPRLTLHAGLDVPLLLTLYSSITLSIPVLVGGGGEYALSERVALTLRLRFGPSFNLNWFFPVTFGFEALAGVALRL